MSDDPIRVDYETLSSLQRQLKGLSVALDNSKSPVHTAHADVVAGAGEVAHRLATDVAGFELAWRVSLEVMSSGAALVGNNIGELELDFTAMDVDYSRGIRL